MKHQRKHFASLRISSFDIQLSNHHFHVEVVSSNAKLAILMKIARSYNIHPTDGRLVVSYMTIQQLK